MGSIESLESRLATGSSLESRPVEGMLGRMGHVPIDDNEGDLSESGCQNCDSSSEDSIEEDNHMLRLQSSHRNRADKTKRSPTVI